MEEENSVKNNEELSVEDKKEVKKESVEKDEDKKEKEEKKSVKSDKNAKGSKKTKAICISVAIIVLLIFSVIFAIINIGSEKIYGKISIMGIEVGNMTRDEAKENLNKIIDKKMTEELVLKKDDYETSINAIQLDAKFNIDKAVNEAYNIGKSGNIITNNYSILYTMIFGKNIDCDFSYSEDLLNEKVNDVASKMPGAVVQSSYYIEDDNLIIVKGKQGLTIKEDELKNNIINEIKDIKQNYDIITIPTDTVSPDEINIEEIKNEIYKEPQDAYVSKNSETGKVEVHTHVNGVDFAVSIDKAKEILAEDKQEYTIPLKITIP